VFVVDTNILLYAVNPDSADHQLARTKLEEWRAGDRPWFLTWGIAYEFLWVSTHPRVFPSPLAPRTAQGWLGILLDTPNVAMLVETARHGEVLREIVGEYPRARGNILHDLHIAAVMKEHGVAEIRTADTDFNQFRFLNVVNPLSP
jgi:toxin-antitoxin system PIN domain toxin